MEHNSYDTGKPVQRIGRILGIVVLFFIGIQLASGQDMRLGNLVNATSDGSIKIYSTEQLSLIVQNQIFSDFDISKFFKQLIVHPANDQCLIDCYDEMVECNPLDTDIPLNDFGSSLNVNIMVEDWRIRNVSFYTEKDVSEFVNTSFYDETTNTTTYLMVLTNWSGNVLNTIAVNESFMRDSDSLDVLPANSCRRIGYYYHRDISDVKTKFVDNIPRIILRDIPGYPNTIVEVSDPSRAWWNNTWGNKSIYNVSSSVMSVDNCQVLIVVNWTTGMNTNFSDMRFTQNTTTNPTEFEVPYWIMNYTPSVNASVWVKINVSVGTNLVFMYWNNPNAATTSNGTKTMIYQKDFESQEFNDWTAGNKATLAILTENGNHYLNGRLNYLAAGVFTTLGYVTSLNSSQLIYEGNLRYGYGTGTNQYEYDGVTIRHLSNVTFNVIISQHNGVQGQRFLLYQSLKRLNNNVRTDVGTSDNLWNHNISRWWHFTVRTNSTGYINMTLDNRSYAWTDNTLPSGSVGFAGFENSESGNMSIDNIFVREYIAPEPTVNFVGFELAPTTTCTPPNPPGTDWVVNASENCIVSGKNYVVGKITFTDTGTLSVTNSNITAKGMAMKNNVKILSAPPYKWVIGT